MRATGVRAEDLGVAENANYAQVRGDEELGDLKELTIVHTGRLELPIHLPFESFFAHISLDLMDLAIREDDGGHDAERARTACRRDKLTCLVDAGSTCRDHGSA